MRNAGSGAGRREGNSLLPRSLLLAAVVAAFTFSTAAGAVTVSFECITGNSTTDCGIGESQLTVDVTAGPGANQVTFHFKNAGPLASSITDVYFDDGTLLGIASVVDGPGVDFEQNASPPDLPGGDDLIPPFETTEGFSADSEPPAQPNGANPGEWVKIIFDLISGQDLDDTLAALDDGSLRIGIHVQGFSGGGSEGFVNVPEPALGLLLLGSWLGLRRRLRAH
jgi:hypothetical protein